MFGIRVSHPALGVHGFGYFGEAGQVGAGQEVAFDAVLPGGGLGLLVAVGHDDFQVLPPESPL